MAKVISQLPSGGSVPKHNNLLGLNEGAYLHLTQFEKAKLDGIQSGAEVNVNTDWNAVSGDAQILNKPASFPPSTHTHTISEVVNLENELNGKASTNALDYLQLNKEDKANKQNSLVPDITGEKYPTVNAVIQGIEQINNGRENIDLNNLTAIHAESPLTTPTFDGSGQAIHPSVLYIENGLSGYKYWMAMTPFTNSNDGVETPSVLVSNDRLTWIVPPGVTNPIVTQETLPVYTYDIEIIQGLDGKLYIYYGKNNQTLNKNYTYVISSVNGITWSSPTEILQYTNPNFALSPTVIIENGVYAMYYVDNSSSSRKLVKITSSSPDSGWNTSSIVTCPILNLPAGKSIWHLTIRKYYNDYHCLAILSDTSGTWQNSIVYFMESKDGVNFNCSSNVLLNKVESTWYSDKVYRSAFLLLDQNKYAVWYSAQSTLNVWRTGYTEIYLDNIIRKEEDSSQTIFSLWSGTQAQYDALPYKKSTTLYFII